MDCGKRSSKLYGCSIMLKEFHPERGRSINTIWKHRDYFNEAVNRWNQTDGCLEGDIFKGNLFLCSDGYSIRNCQTQLKSYLRLYFKDQTSNQNINYWERENKTIFESIKNRMVWIILFMGVDINTWIVNYPKNWWRNYF